MIGRQCLTPGCTNEQQEARRYCRQCRSAYDVRRHKINPLTAVTCVRCGKKIRQRGGERFDYDMAGALCPPCRHVARAERAEEMRKLGEAMNARAIWKDPSPGVDPASLPPSRTPPDVERAPVLFNERGRKQPAWRIDV